MKNSTINLDSDSDSGDDGDFFVPNNDAGVGGHGNKEHGLLADCEYWQQRNLDLQREIDRLRALKNEHEQVSALDQRKMELVWKHLPPKPWSFSYFSTFRGFEFTQIYLWILRDLGWAWGQIWFYPCAVFGALLLCMPP